MSYFFINNFTFTVLFNLNFRGGYIYNFVFLEMQYLKFIDLKNIFGPVCISIN